MSKNLKPRKREDLIFEYTFKVDGVDYKLDIHRDSNSVIGSTASVIGHSPRMLLKVKCVDRDIPVKSINFLGYIPLQKGDRIKAQLNQYSTKSYGHGLHKKVEFYERELEEQETSNRLEKLSEDGTVLAVAHS